MATRSHACDLYIDVIDLLFYKLLGQSDKTCGRDQSQTVSVHELPCAGKVFGVRL